MTRIGHGYDAHRFAEGRPCIIGGVRIPHDRGPLGHSDADPLAHAICDAVLGAAALGDLGTHFPDSDGRWAGADSMDILRRCGAKLEDAGYRVVNVDATVVVERPRLAAHLPEMRANVASQLRIDLDAVSVKAKSSEGMGFTGDGSGIAAYAVAAIAKRTN